MNIGRNHFQLEQIRRQTAGNSGNMFTFSLVNMFCAERGIFCFNQFPVILIQKIHDIEEWQSDGNVLL